MAEFKTHLTVSSLCSSAAATFLLAAALATPEEVLLFFIMGVVGGLLPDIDSDSSLPVRLLFTFIATVISFLIMFHQRADNSAVELFTLWLGSFLVIKCLIFSMFTRITVHRGIIHSVPASLFFWLVTTIILYHFFNFSKKTVWMAGFFMFGGFILHLLLDELVSLNLSGKKPKNSSGTAFKFANAKDLKSTVAVYALTALLFTAAPDYTPFVRTYFSSTSLTSLRVFPEGTWFKHLYRRYLIRWQTKTAGAPDIPVGSPRL
ncbi:metal-dependent hydrolase [Desulfoluna sp.]|uniref:metal-dependent hydrolase n=1 Tax=Desulfoluna sp. TaxID=2045199 RepID=UPI0026177742|nr:metal-dependent hydrolase [Desulfoluna sp.]